MALFFTPHFLGFFPLPFESFESLDSLGSRAPQLGDHVRQGLVDILRKPSHGKPCQHRDAFSDAVEKKTLWKVMFNSYVKLPEGISHYIISHWITIKSQNHMNSIWQWHNVTYISWNKEPTRPTRQSPQKLVTEKWQPITIEKLEFDQPVIFSCLHGVSMSTWRW